MGVSALRASRKMVPALCWPRPPAHLTATAEAQTEVAQLRMRSFPVYIVEIQAKLASQTSVGPAAKSQRLKQHHWLQQGRPSGSRYRWCPRYLCLRNRRIRLVRWIVSSGMRA